MNLENIKVMKEYAELVLAGKSVSHLESAHVHIPNWSKANGDSFLSDNVRYRWGKPEKEMVKHKGGMYPKPLTKEQILAVPINTNIFCVRVWITSDDVSTFDADSDVFYDNLEDAQAALKVLMNE